MTDGISAARPATDSRSTRLAAAVWLRAALVAALLATVIVVLFDLAVAERVVDRAVAEEAGGRLATGAPEPFTRGEQRGGLVLAELLYALGAGLALAGAATLLGPVQDAVRRWLLLVVAGCWSLVLVPFVAMPPLPPGVESSFAIGERRAVFAVAIALGVAGAAACALLWRRSAGRQPVGRAVGACVPLVVTLALAVALPAGRELGDPDAGLVQDFRLVALAGQFVVWGALGVGGMTLLQRLPRG